MVTIKGRYHFRPPPIRRPRSLPEFRVKQVEHPTAYREGAFSTVVSNETSGVPLDSRGFVINILGKFLSSYNILIL
jgi:hypothetical protein